MKLITCVTFRLNDNVNQNKLKVVSNWFLSYDHHLTSSYGIVGTMVNDVQCEICI